MYVLFVVINNATHSTFKKFTRSYPLLINNRFKKKCTAGILKLTPNEYLLSKKVPSITSIGLFPLRIISIKSVSHPRCVSGVEDIIRVVIIDLLAEGVSIVVIHHPPKKKC